MSEYLFKTKTMAVLCTVIAISSGSFISAANSAGKEQSSVRQVENQLSRSATQRTGNGPDYNWGNPCNDFGPVGSVNLHTTLGKKGPVDRIACELAKKKMVRK